MCWPASLAHDPAAIETLLVTLFLDSHQVAPKELMLDLDATDDPLHGHREGRFFHGYYDCYCYLPLYVFCGEQLLAAKLRPSNIDASAGAVEEIARIVRQIRAHWPDVRIIVRADSGFAREELMAWCEENAVDYILGLGFVPRADIDQRFFDTPYYISPSDPVGQEAFAVIREAMRQQGPGGAGARRAFQARAGDGA